MVRVYVFVVRIYVFARTHKYEPQIGNCEPHDGPRVQFLGATTCGSYLRDCGSYLCVCENT